MNNPCWNCKEREMYCHSDCDKYLEHKEILEKKKTFLEVDKIFGNYVYHAVKRMKGVRV